MDVIAGLFVVVPFAIVFFAACRLIVLAIHHVPILIYRYCQRRKRQVGS